MCAALYIHPRFASKVNNISGFQQLLRKVERVKVTELGDFFRQRLELMGPYLKLHKFSELPDFRWKMGQTIIKEIERTKLRKLTNLWRKTGECVLA